VLLKRRIPHPSEGRNGSATSVFPAQVGRNLEVMIPARGRTVSTVQPWSELAMER